LVILYETGAFKMSGGGGGGNVVTTTKNTVSITNFTISPHQQ